MNNFLIKNGVESAKAVSFSMAIDANRGLYDGAFVSTGITSRELSERLPFDAMCWYYPGLHTVDEEMATDIICKDYHFAKKPDIQC